VTTSSGPAGGRPALRTYGLSAAGSDGRGHGLIGIHERVKLYGGEMSTATTTGGGFTLTARLPLTEYRS
jgi:sensor histidine kinase regulating citrate/malate metabolism